MAWPIGGVAREVPIWNRLEWMVEMHALRGCLSKVSGCTLIVRGAWLRAGFEVAVSDGR